MVPRTHAYPGTEIVVYKHTGNPAADERMRAVFCDDYYEILVSCKGTNPYFPKRDWTIFIVNLIDGSIQAPEISPEAGVITMTVELNSTLTSVTTMVSALPVSDGSCDGKMHACIVAEFHSPETGITQAMFICNETAQFSFH